MGGGVRSPFLGRSWIFYFFFIFFFNNKKKKKSVLTPPPSPRERICCYYNQVMIRVDFHKFTITKVVLPVRLSPTRCCRNHWTDVTSPFHWVVRQSERMGIFFFFFLVSKFGNLTFCSVGRGVRSPFLGRSWNFFFFFFFFFFFYNNKKKKSKKKSKKRGGGVLGGVWGGGGVGFTHKKLPKGGFNPPNDPPPPPLRTRLHPLANKQRGQLSSKDPPPPPPREKESAVITTKVMIRVDFHKFTITKVVLPVRLSPTRCCRNHWT